MTSVPGMGTYRPLVGLALYYTTPSQSEIGRSVALGVISTLCGQVSILVISVFVPRLSMLYMYVWMGYERGMVPYRPQMTVTLCTIPDQ